MLNNSTRINSGKKWYSFNKTFIKAFLHAPTAPPLPVGAPVPSSIIILSSVTIPLHDFAISIALAAN